MSNAGPANVKHHLSKHPKYKKKLEEMERAEKSKKKGLQQGLAKFVMHGKEVQLPSVIHAGKHFVLRPGEAVNVLRCYFRTQDGNLLDARSLVPPKCDPPEVIELD
uniref:Uncharacterized protein n=1 Tax=Ditylenchus dipsaci TaxID=166011 RepID=A0A915E345_9BILA